MNGSESLAFKILVGADGVNSIVRRYLKIPVEKRLIGIQYLVPGDFEPRLEIFLNSRLFGPWYAWIFPHKDSIAVGTVCAPRFYPAKKLKENFHRWLRLRKLDISNAIYQSWPISYDYRGFRFGNVFLAGEAAGLASGLSGEGIYQSLVSGETVARTILDKSYHSADFDRVLHYNDVQLRFIKILIKAGWLRGAIQALIIMALNNPVIQKRISNSFS